MMTPEDLDELLQVNPTRTWLMFAGIGVVIAGMLAWGILGSVTQYVKGFGIIKTRELPREVVSVCSGQVDSIFCKTGDEVAQGQKLLMILQLHEQTGVTIFASCPGEITGLNVREGTYVETGAPVLEMMRNEGHTGTFPEVIFFVEEQEVSKLKKGMVSNLQIDKGGVPPEFLNAVINFIADYPVSKNSIQKYFPDEEITKQLSNRDFHEVRASLIIDTVGKSARAKEALRSLNGLSCRTVTTVARRSPVAYLLN
ncbi:MAG: hypothetical protein ACOYM0_00440 [Bacteroidales bacterium]